MCCLMYLEGRRQGGRQERLVQYPEDGCPRGFFPTLFPQHGQGFILFPSDLFVPVHQENQGHFWTFSRENKEGIACAPSPSPRKILPGMTLA